MNESSLSAPPARGAWRSPVILDDLTADLIWPRLLKAGSLSLRPSRLFLAFFYLIGVAAMVAIAGSLDGVEGNALALAGEEWLVHLTSLINSCASMDATGIGRALTGIFVRTAWDLLAAHPVIAVVFLPLLLIWTTLMGGAISRMIAMDFAQGVGLSWPEGLGYAIGRWSSFAGSVLGPLALMYAVLLAMAVGGWAMFNVPILNILGGALWVLFLIGAAVVAVIMLAMTLGGPMLVPAVACEGTDAIDAVQHAYSYVFAKPLRLLVYIAILAAQFFLVALVVGAVVWLIVNIAQTAAATWVGAAGTRVIAGEAGLEGVDAAAGAAVRLWSAIPILLGSAFAVSYFWSAATVLYLAMRRICDGQDISEVWVDTVVPGTMAERRYAPKSGTAPAGSIVDNGPADET